MKWILLKPKLMALGALVLAAIAAVAKINSLKDKSEKLKRDAETYKKQVAEVKALQEADAEINNDISELKREAKKDLDNDKMPRNIRDRNNF